MKKIWIIFGKEVLDNLRDKRSWATGLFWALFGPVMMGGHAARSGLLHARSDREAA